MDTAKIFQDGRSEAIRLPKEFRFEGTEVLIKRVGNAVVAQNRVRSPSSRFHSTTLSNPASTRLTAELERGLI